MTFSIIIMLRFSTQCVDGKLIKNNFLSEFCSKVAIDFSSSVRGVMTVEEVVDLRAEITGRDETHSIG